MQTAKSLVIIPDSTVSIQTRSNSLQKLINASLLSNFHLKAKPLVHAKMDAIGLVDVFLPA